LHYREIEEVGIKSPTNAGLKVYLGSTIRGSSVRISL